MAKRITEEMKVQINELYIEYGVKKRVAEILSISPSTVSKYIIPNYKSQKETKIEFSTPPRGCRAFIKNIQETNFCDACGLTEEEQNELKQFQKECF